MSDTDRYFTLPLSILHCGTSALDALGKGLSCGIVNAGLGYRQTDGEPAFQILLESAKACAQQQQQMSVERPQSTPMNLWEAALAGAELLGVSGGLRAQDIANYQAHWQPGAVFFRLRSDWMWNAIYSAREAAGKPTGTQNERKPLSWREFRILAAILSAPVNKQDFTFLGWESIQARSCGYHSKALFAAAAATLPAHCQPLSRRIIRQELEKMEALGFFLRCRYSSGKRGGLMAYSFRHSDRYDLTDSIMEWREDNRSFQTQAAENRTADLAYFAVQPLIEAVVKNPNDKTASRNLMAARKALPAKSMMSPNSDVF